MKAYVTTLDSTTGDNGRVLFSGTENAALKFANDYASRNGLKFKSNNSIYGGYYSGNIGNEEGVCVAVSHSEKYPL